MCESFSKEGEDMNPRPNLFIRQLLLIVLTTLVFLMIAQPALANHQAKDCKINLQTNNREMEATCQTLFQTD